MVEPVVPPNDLSPEELGRLIVSPRRRPVANSNRKKASAIAPDDTCLQPFPTLADVVQES